MRNRILHRHSQAAPILLDGLSKLEYRGYDSAGLAVRDGENKTKIVKDERRLKALSEKNRSWSCSDRYLWYRSHPLGYPRGTF